MSSRICVRNDRPKSLATLRDGSSNRLRSIEEGVGRSPLHWFSDTYHRASEFVSGCTHNRVGLTTREALGCQTSSLRDGQTSARGNTEFRSLILPREASKRSLALISGEFCSHIYIPAVHGLYAQIFKALQKVAIVTTDSNFWISPGKSLMAKCAYTGWL